jgi:Leucine-rich repeat (LRR) protein
LNGRITHLNLGAQGLHGSVPVSLLDLTALTFFSLWDNQFEGSIPSAIGQLTALTTLELPNNQLTGSIPSTIGQLTELTSLGLGYNNLVGSIPSTIAKVTKLVHLGLTKLSGLGGTIPSAIGQLTALASLDLNSNQLTGAIPTSIGQLTVLAYLNLNNNNLGGSIPSTIGKLTELTTLILGHNQLTGPVPQEMLQLKKLTHFSMENNPKLWGTLPKFNFSQFTDCCTMSGDAFTCPLPPGANTSCVGGPGCGSGPHVPPPTCNPLCDGSSSTLTASDCSAWQRFTRDPMYTGWAESKCGAKVHTDPCNCTFHGKVQCYRRPKKHAKSRITRLDLGNQGLPPSGGIPLALLDLTGLESFQISNNYLTGSIPSSIDQLRSLTYFDVSNNKLGGSIPSTIAKLTGLTNIRFWNNQLTGSVPQEMLQLKKLIFIGLGLGLENNSRLTGLLPKFNFSQFTDYCAMSGDTFTCPLPAGAQHCVGGPAGERLPPPTCAHCDGSSSTLTASDCSAWQHFSRDPHFSATLLAKCPAAVLDPCSCTFYDHVQCADGRITRLHMSKQSLAGPFPASLLKLAGLTYL